MKKTISREEQLFLAASELDDPGDRRAFLSQACGDDNHLLDRVNDLLEIDSQDGAILDETSQGLFQATPPEETIKPGTTIGPYKLLQQIGRGGMGIVFMARQSRPIRRKVAVKVIRFGMDSKNVIARFEAERQALALMDHPGITRVLDAGTTECGRPYFVMELINGIPVTQYCDRNRLRPRERVELFLNICNAVQHAHQKGIIHRDIKPSNILITNYDGVPVPKIIDFGIAKALDRPLTEKTLFTSFGNMIGTPEYMSPEQAEMSGLDTDVCSDVYSLGVVLFELLTGTTPFFEHSRQGLRKICDAVCTQDAELASTRVHRLTDSVQEVAGNRRCDGHSLRQVLRGDLDWIIARCLNKDRRDRYQTAAELANDVQRYLDGDVVEAGAPSAMYRLKKAARKHAGLLAVAVAILVSLVTATGVSMAYAFRAFDAERVAKQQRVEAELARDRAVEAERRMASALEEARILAETNRRLFNELARQNSLFSFSNGANLDTVQEQLSAIGQWPDVNRWRREGWDEQGQDRSLQGPPQILSQVPSQIQADGSESESSGPVRTWLVDPPANEYDSQVTGSMPAAESGTSGNTQQQRFPKVGMDFEQRNDVQQQAGSRPQSVQSQIVQAQNFRPRMQQVLPQQNGIPNVPPESGIGSMPETRFYSQKGSPEPEFENVPQMSEQRIGIQQDATTGRPPVQTVNDSQNAVDGYRRVNMLESGAIQLIDESDNVVVTVEQNPLPKQSYLMLNNSDSALQLQEQDRVLVRNLLSTVIDSRKEVQGEHCNSLAKPLLSQANFDVNCNQWADAEQPLQACEDVLRNNSWPVEILGQVKILRAIVLLKQGREEEGLALIRELRQTVDENPDRSQEPGSKYGWLKGMNDEQIIAELQESELLSTLNSDLEGAFNRYEEAESRANQETGPRK